MYRNNLNPHDCEGYALTRWVERLEVLEPYPDYTDDWDPPQYDPCGEAALFRRSGYSDLGEPWHNEDEFVDERSQLYHGDGLELRPIEVEIIHRALHALAAYVPKQHTHPETYEVSAALAWFEAAQGVLRRLI